MIFRTQAALLQRNKGKRVHPAADIVQVRSRDHDLQRIAVRDKLCGPASHKQQRGKEVPQPEALHGSSCTVAVH